MANQKRQPRAAVRRLQDRLDKAQRQLFELENSRTLRTYHHFRHSVVNPLWGLKNLHKLPGLFQKMDFPDVSATTSTYRPGLPGDEEGSFMPYPNLKVASLGRVPDLAIYCHHMLTEDSEWLRLMEKGIDVLVVGDLAGYDQKRIDDMVKRFVADNIPIFYLYPNTKVASIKAKNLENYLAVDLAEYNPIGLPEEQPNQPAGIYSRTGAGQASFSELSKESFYQFSSVNIDPKQFDQDYQHALAVLSCLSCGIPVETPKTALLAKLLPKDYPFGKSAQGLGYWDWKQRSVKYRRFVHLNFSPRALATEIAGAAKFETVDYDPTISTIMSTRRPDLVMKALKQYKAIVYPKKELLLVLHGKGFDTEAIKAETDKLKQAVKIFEVGEKSIFGENLNLALDAATGEYVTKMDDDDCYGPNIYQDLLAAYQYSRATFVGKRCNVTYLEDSDVVVTFFGGWEETFGPHLPGHSFLTRTALLKQIRFGRVKRAIDSELWRRVETRGGTLYSTHNLNFVRVRHGQEHTYDATDEEFIANSTTKPVKGLDLKKYFV